MNPFTKNEIAALEDKIQRYQKLLDTGSTAYSEAYLKNEIAAAKARIQKLKSTGDSGGHMIKTLKDLNNAGRRFWSRPNRDDAGKRAQDKLSVAQALKNLEAAEREERASQGYISRLNTARRAVALARLELEIAQNAADAVHPMTKHNAPPGMEKCPNCGGYGRKYGEPCDVCHGEGFIPEGSADAKDADHHTFVPGGPDGTCKICKQRYDSPIHSDQTGSQRDSTNPSEPHQFREDPETGRCIYCDKEQSDKIHSPNWFKQNK